MRGLVLDASEFLPVHQDIRPHCRHYRIIERPGFNVRSVKQDADKPWGERDAPRRSLRCALPPMAWRSPSPGQDLAWRKEESGDPGNGIPRVGSQAVRAARRDEATLLGEVLADAFAEDPVFAWLIPPQPPGRDNRLRTFFTSMSRSGTGTARRSTAS